MLQLICAEIGNTWSLPFENPFIIWFQSLGGTNGYFHYFLYYLFNFISMFGEEMILVGVVGLLYWGLDKKGGERVGFMMISVRQRRGYTKFPRRFGVLLPVRPLVGVGFDIRRNRRRV